MAVGLCHSHIDGQISFAFECDAVLEHEPRTPANIWQSINAELAAKSTGVEDDRGVAKLVEVNLARHKIRLDPKLAGSRLIKPDIYARKISGRHRGPSQSDTGRDFLHFTFRIEEIYGRKALDAVVHDRKLALPHRLAANAAVFRALPKESFSAGKIGRQQ